jgi:hypothetical protein
MKDGNTNFDTGAAQKSDYSDMIYTADAQCMQSRYPTVRYEKNLPEFSFPPWTPPEVYVPEPYVPAPPVSPVINLYYSLNGSDWVDMGSATLDCDTYIYVAGLDGNEVTTMYMDDFTVTLPAASSGYSDDFTGDLSKWDEIEPYLAISSGTLIYDVASWPMFGLIKSKMGSPENMDVQIKTYIDVLDSTATRLYVGTINVVDHVWFQNVCSIEHIDGGAGVRKVRSFKTFYDGGTPTQTLLKQVELDTDDKTVYLRIVKTAT